mmetsp:Transcript_22819/g.34032  ORF Transcript_22819/g.34032 Transcript_22819/m.34032 type:complete len:315 (-) Transcript_22819:218-1162(-)|eukprot:CAMPEP_0167767106 /NCGR_PEP_ID=MMETSP0110_2-20121227/15820_1 /TAXON_ID=629695 /ORGANISM="Gymnochlora sp., Strain CCMP2014" /LENGTH=314 /DNA_ID=CAMNT_0007655417 /DNA_START=63 /DNA_END=1007 /DNA_ORIENTATION=+
MTDQRKRHLSVDPHGALTAIAVAELQQLVEREMKVLDSEMLKLRNSHERRMEELQLRKQQVLERLQRTRNVTHDEELIVKRSQLDRARIQAGSASNVAAAMMEVKKFVNDKMKEAKDKCDEALIMKERRDSLRPLSGRPLIKKKKVSVSPELKLQLCINVAKLRRKDRTKAYEMFYRDHGVSIRTQRDWMTSYKRQLSEGIRPSFNFTGRPRMLTHQDCSMGVTAYATEIEKDGDGKIGEIAIMNHIMDAKKERMSREGKALSFKIPSDRTVRRTMSLITTPGPNQLIVPVKPNKAKEKYFKIKSTYDHVNQTK